MKYVGTFFLSKLPFCFEKQEMVNGVEKTCLVIPCDEAQLDRTRHGAWFIRLKCTVVPPNPQRRAIKLMLGYRSWPEVHKAKKLRYYNETEDMGYLFVDSHHSNAKKIDKTNNMTDILCTGKIFLDSVQREDIKVDSQTGRRYIDFSFRKTALLDSFGNSHELIVKTGYGEHQIGLAREIVNDQKRADNTATTHSDSKDSKTSPSEYEGYNW